MKSIKHRLLSLLLTLVTILSLLPTAAFAASNTGSGLKITTNQAYWSTRLLANGTPYSYRPPLADGKLVYCMDSGLGYHYATASYLNSFTWTSGTGADADAVLQSAVTNSGLGEMDAATVENVKRMMTALDTERGRRSKPGECIVPLRKLTGKRKAVGRIFGENALASPTWQEPTGKWTER